MSDEEWQGAVAQAQARVEIVERVLRRREETGEAWATSVGRITSEVPPTTFVHWVRWARSWSGPLWERFVFARLQPPPAERTSASVVAAAEALRHADPTISVASAQRVLRKQFGGAVGLSGTNLKRIWQRAGLSRPGGRVATETVEEYSGGAGLVLVQVADEVLGACATLARAVQEAGKKVAGAQGDLAVRVEGPGERDEHGRFTKEYNEHWRQGVAPGEADGRWAPETIKRAQRDLSTLPVLDMRRATLASSLLQMGMTPLLTSRRGFDGLADPAGNWLGALGATAYMPATLEKRETQLGLLGVEGAMWQAHCKLWQPVSLSWSKGEGWWLCAVYIDATLTEYWTERFALTGKVERSGRVRPSVTRLMITGGPGVPLLVETSPGMVSLKTTLLPLLDRLEDAIGERGVRRLFIFDAEMATAHIVSELCAHAEREFITVLKGPLRKAVTITAVSDWQPFRERDALREVQVVVPARLGLPQDLTIRGVELQRPGSRNAYSLVYVTSASEAQMSREEVVALYLSRWPHEEQVFRNGRNGGGLHRTHGYGGENIVNVALPTSIEKSKHAVARAEATLATQTTHRKAAEQAAGDDPKNKALQTAVTQARRSERAAKSNLTRVQAMLEKQESTPRTIYRRDTARDSAMTCLKLTIVMLIEYVLREYFAGLRLEWRTFIDAFVPLPVTVRTTPARIRYQFHANRRAPERMRQLQAACEALNAKQLRRGKERRLLMFEVVGLPEPSS